MNQPSKKKTANLTARTVKAIRPEAKPFRIWDKELKGFHIRVQPSGSMSYYFHYRTEAGKAVSYRIGNAGALSPVQARDVAELKSRKVAEGKDIQAEKKQKRIEGREAKFKTLGGFIEHKYGPWVEASRKTGAETLKRLDTQFSHWMTKPLDALTKWDVDKWRSNERKRGKSPATINRDVTALKAALSKAVEWELIDKNPLAKVKPIKTDSRGVVRYLSGDEEIALRNALDMREQNMRDGRGSANEWRRVRGYPLLPDIIDTTFADHIKPMVLLSLNTGMRRGEVFSLTWEAVNLNTAMLTVLAKTAKSNKTRHIPLNDEAKAALENWQAQTGQTSGLVFPNPAGKRFNNVKRSWATVLKLAGITGFRWHDLRHCFASRLVMAGVDLNTVRELMGHGDIKMTLRYAHLAPEHKAAAVAKLTAPQAGNVTTLNAGHANV